MGFTRIISYFSFLNFSLLALFLILLSPSPKPQRFPPDSRNDPEPKGMTPVCSEKMYKAIADFGRGLELDQMARVDTKYNTVDRKVRLLAAPLPEGSELWMKGVASDRSLRDPAGIGHRFTDITPQELKVGWVAFYCRLRRTGFGDCSGGTGRPSHSHWRRSGV